jgi:hypothetical protein
MHLDRRSPMRHIIEQLALHPEGVSIPWLAATYEHPPAIRVQDYGRLKSQYAHLKTDLDCANWLIQDALENLAKYLVLSSNGHVRFANPNIVTEYGITALSSEAATGVPPGTKLFSFATSDDVDGPPDRHANDARVISLNQLKRTPDGTGRIPIKWQLASWFIELSKEHPDGYFTVTREQIAAKTGLQIKSVDSNMRNIRQIREFFIPLQQGGVFKNCQFKGIVPVE